MRLVLAVLLCTAAPAALCEDVPRKMESDKPMTSKMKKPGMKQSDVKREADKKAREMKPELKREGESMGKPTDKDGAR